jgi:hypothetical protein
MQIKNLKIFDSTAPADGAWIDISNLVALSVSFTGVEASTWIEVSNDPDININAANSGAVLAAPSAPVLSQSAYGNLTSQGTYFVKTTYTTKWGETTPSAEASFTVTDGNVLVAQPPAKDALGLATGYNVYVSKVTNTETLQTGPPYVPAHVVDATPGIHWAINGVLPLNQPFVLSNGLQPSSTVVPIASTAGGVGIGTALMADISAATSGEEIAIFKSGNTAIVNPSCLCWKWLRVRKSTGSSLETVAWILGQTG